MQKKNKSKETSHGELKSCQFTKLSQDKIRLIKRQNSLHKRRTPLKPSKERKKFDKTHIMSQNLMNEIPFLKYHQSSTSFSNQKKDSSQQQSINFLSKLKNNKLKTMDFETESSLINEGNIIESLSEIKNIIKTIKKLKQFGFSEQKVTGWMLNYFGKTKNTIKSIFVNQYTNKKSIDNLLSYEHQTNFENIRGTIIKMFINAKYRKQYQTIKELTNLNKDLKHFRIYLQEILLKKNTIKIKQLRKTMKNKYRSIHPDDWDSVKQIIQPRYSYSLEIADFLYDLYRTEKDHGKFQKITQYNRQKLKEIQEAQNCIRKEYNIINCGI